MSEVSSTSAAKQRASEQSTESVQSPITRAEPSVVPTQDGAVFESHFWAASFPFFKSTLFISPRVFGSNENQTDDEQSASLVIDSLVRIFDADGDLINDIEVKSSANDITVLELDPFLGAAKLQGGQKHVHIYVKSEGPAFHMCRLHTAKGASTLGEPLPLSLEHSVFFPIRVGEERQNQLCVVSHNEQSSSVKCRLFMGARTPEFYFSIPANGSRIFGIEEEFADHLESLEGEKQCYIRLSTKSRGALGVQLVERVGSAREIGMYSSVS